jgi:hypothetical protein
MKKNWFKNIALHHIDGNPNNSDLTNLRFFDIKNSSFMSTTELVDKMLKEAKMLKRIINKK